jgi:MFS transporter, ACS family, hexuronate transporter
VLVLKKLSLMQNAPSYRWVILGVAWLVELCNAFSYQAIAPLAALFQPELGLNKTEVGFFASAPFLGAWALLLIAGPLTDRIGVRKMACAGLIVTGIFTLSMSIATTFFFAAAVMLGAGLGRGLTGGCSSKAIGEWFPVSSRGTAMGIKQTGMPLAGVLCASALPLIALALGWRGAIGLVGILIILGGGVAGLLFRDVSDPKGTPARTEKLMDSLGTVMRNRQLWMASIMAVLLLTVQLSANAYIALYLHDVVLVTAIPDAKMRVVAAGGFLALCQVGGVGGRIFWGLVSDRIFHGQRMLVMAIIGALVTISSIMVGYLDLGFPLWVVTAVVFLYGVVTIGFAGLSQALVVETVGRKHAATGIGLFMTVTQLGKVVGPPLFGLVADLTGTYRMGWFLMAGLAACGTAVAIASRGGEKQLD